MKKDFFSKHVVFLFLLIVIICFLSGCQRSPTPISKTGLFFDTAITITLYDTGKEEILEECFSLCEEYEKIFSKTREDSELYLINHSPEQTFPLSEDLNFVLQKGLTYCEQTKGAFDITLGAVSSLWNFSTEHASVPEPLSLKSAMEHIGYQNLSLKDSILTKKDPLIQIDLGGLAKGYIADRIKDYLLEKKVGSALIDLGGNILCVGEKPDGSPFQIGIQKPFEDHSETIAIMEIRDQSVVSSGIYERFFKQNEKLYHHILNPKTGYPYDNSLAGVTVISDTSIDGDALSTSLFSLGLEDGLKLVDSIDHTYAVFITKDDQLHFSKGFQEAISISGN